MSQIVDVLMRRDGMTKAEATAKLKEVRKMVRECGYDAEEVEDIMASELGLELDYVFELI
ncbi:MAG: hypothetical protein LUG99_08910 [Lachnospiraceae bacterium]|nr:hypothetical protein [Lachnospiraceae bacterium]